jgi:UDP-N-acetylmuramate dehydrogenase
MHKRHSLKKYNTFGIDVSADEIIKIRSEEDIRKWHEQNPDKNFLILGEGSNVLFINDFNGTILLNEIKGKKIITEDENKLLLHVKGGEKWHDLVLWAVDNNYGGIENLALIPGKTGTAPIQNIGAYGREVKDVIDKVHAYDFKNKQYVSFDNKECQFGYRDSIFKKPENKNRYFITSIDLILTKKDHQLNTSYGAIQEIFKKKGIENPQIKDVAQAVIEIRQSKLPDPKKVGNAGSFFKNPIINNQQFETIQQQYPDIPFYKLSENKIKIPAGWLIEKAGFKGRSFGNTGVHDKQALVLINRGNAQGEEVKKLADKIIAKVKQDFGISLIPEVNFIF